MLEVARACESLLLDGVPLSGVCLYPILSMPEWHAPDVWTPMGLWDPICDREPHEGRLVCEPMLNALQSVRHVDDLYRALVAPEQEADAMSRRRRRAGLKGGWLRSKRREDYIARDGGR
jgi:hypothetical protein